MHQGTVKKLLADKGFGFISGEQGDVFLHKSGVVSGTFESLRVGQAVSYEVEEGKNGKGPRAVNVQPVGDG